MESAVRTGLTRGPVSWASFASVPKVPNHWLTGIPGHGHSFFAQQPGKIDPRGSQRRSQAHGESQQADAHGHGRDRRRVEWLDVKEERVDEADAEPGEEESKTDATANEPEHFAENQRAELRSL